MLSTSRRKSSSCAITSTEFSAHTRSRRDSYTAARRSLRFLDNAGRHAARWLCTCRTNDSESDSARRVPRRVFPGGTYRVPLLDPPAAAGRARTCCESPAAFPEIRATFYTSHTTLETVQACL